MNGIQAWVALPEEDEETTPEFVHYGVEQLPSAEADGVWMRIIAGDALGLRSNVRTHSPLFYIHCELRTGARATLPHAYPERAAYILKGSVEAEGQTYTEGQMLVFGSGADATFTAATPAIVMLLGGEPIGERFIEWNFVSSSKERIEQAKADWRAGRMKLPDRDNAEFIPLPGDPAPPANPMS